MRNALRNDGFDATVSARALMILAGIATNVCVLFTANDAYMRDFRLVVPSDCVASISEDEDRSAQAQMRTVLKADTRPSAELSFEVGPGGLGAKPFRGHDGPSTAPPGGDR